MSWSPDPVKKLMQREKQLGKQFPSVISIIGMKERKRKDVPFKRNLM